MSNEAPLAEERLRAAAVTALRLGLLTAGDLDMIDRVRRASRTLSEAEAAYQLDAAGGLDRPLSVIARRMEVIERLLAVQV